MFGFFRRKPRQPEWSKFMPADDYFACVKLIESHLKSRPLTPPFQIVDGVVELEGTDRQMGLQNLLQKCRHSGRENWLGLIRDHFNVMSAAGDQPGAMSFDDARDRLTVRIFDARILEAEFRDHLLFRRHIAGTVSVLCLDSEKSLQTINRHNTSAWPADYDKLFAIALTNTVALSNVKLELLDVGDDVSLRVLLGEDTYTATQALRLEDRYPDLVGEHGSLVAIPTASLLLAYPIDDLSVVAAVTKMIGVAESQHAKGPHPISSRLYWRHRGGGTFVEVPWYVDGDKLFVDPPPAFTALLSELGGGDLPSQ